MSRGDRGKRTNALEHLDLVLEEGFITFSVNGESTRHVSMSSGELHNDLSTLKEGLETCLDDLADEEVKEKTILLMREIEEVSKEVLKTIDSARTWTRKLSRIRKDIGELRRLAQHSI